MLKSLQHQPFLAIGQPSMHERSLNTEACVTTRTHCPSNCCASPKHSPIPAISPVHRSTVSRHTGHHAGRMNAPTASSSPYHASQCPSGISALEYILCRYLQQHLSLIFVTSSHSTGGPLCMLCSSVLVHGPQLCFREMAGLPYPQSSRLG